MFGSAREVHRKLHYSYSGTYSKVIFTKIYLPISLILLRASKTVAAMLKTQ